MEVGREKRHVVDFLFVLTLFFVFAISTLFLVIIGANVYKKTVDNMTINYNTRTAYAYLTEKIRQNDQEGAIEIGTLEGNPAIILTEEIDDTLKSAVFFRLIPSTFSPPRDTLRAGFFTVAVPVFSICISIFFVSPARIEIWDLSFSFKVPWPSETSSTFNLIFTG